MRFDETKWELRICPVGNHCWCRMIFTVTGEEVLHEGAIDRELAEYIVSLHNRNLTRHSSGRLKSCHYKLKCEYAPAGPNCGQCDYYYAAA